MTVVLRILIFLAPLFPGFFRALFLSIAAPALIGAIAVVHSKSPVRDTVGRPTEEVNFITAVQRAKDQFASGSNDMQKGASRPTRAREICAVLRSLQIQNWVGTIEELTSNSDGKGVVTINIGEAILVKTWNNSLSDIVDETLIDPESPLFNKASALVKGEMVFFSGSFLPNKIDCVKEASLSLHGSITSPEFIMKFSDISVYSEQPPPAPIKKSHLTK